MLPEKKVHDDDEHRENIRLLWIVGKPPYLLLFQPRHVIDATLDDLRGSDGRGEAGG